MTTPDLLPSDVPVGARIRALLAAGRLDLPLPGGGRTADRWRAFAVLGRDDLALARLAEGHADAVAILAEAGRPAEPDTLYGVWAARPGGTGADLRGGPLLHGATVLHGTVRFCSGAHLVDRALVVADGPSGRVLVDVPIEAPGARPDPDSWNTPAMAAADTLDVWFDRMPVGSHDVVADPGWYTARPGFALGGGGVAAVWQGGAAGLLERALAHLPASPDAHQLAHLGELDALLSATDAQLEKLAAEIDADPVGDHALGVARVRCAVERVVRETLDRVPRMLGPGPLSGDAELARTLADLGIYVRQHHGERDHAALGAAVFAARDAS